MNGEPAQSQPESSIPDQPQRWLEYHRRVLRYLQSEQPDVWSWFRQDQHSQEAWKQARLELQKDTHPLRPDAFENQSAIVAQAAALLRLAVPISLHQSVHEIRSAAELRFVPDHAHVVFDGSACEHLSADEFLAVLLHELAHHELLMAMDRQFATMEEIVDAFAAEPNSPAVWPQTSRLLRLHTEFYCDHRAVSLMNNFKPLLAALLKLHSGATDVDEQTFAAQMAALTEEEVGTSAGQTHPELHLRARAVQIQDAAERQQQLTGMVYGAWNLTALDVLQQQTVRQTTLDLLQWFLQPAWIRTGPLLGFAKRFDSEFAPVAIDVPSCCLPAEFMNSESLRSYCCYLLLDLATMDPELEEFALAAAVQLAEQLQLTEFQAIAEANLKVGRRMLRQVFADSRDIVDRATTELSP